MLRLVAPSVLALLVSFGLGSARTEAQQLPVIPGASGFGITTPAGRGGQVYRVTNLNDSGQGSFRACLEASGPRVCIFEVSGAIWLNDRLRVTSGQLTIAGQTAPSPGIEVHNGGLLIQASDVLVQHIRFRVGDDPSGPSYENRDALGIEGRSGGLTQNVVIDHCSFSWAIDETATLYFNWDNVTLRNNIFSEALHDSFHPDTSPPGNGQGHSKGLLLNDNSGTGRVAVIGNILANIIDRNPRTLTSDVVLVNNIVYNAGEVHANFDTNGGPSRHSVVGNSFIDGPDSNRWRKSVWLNGLASGSEVYVADNSSPDMVGSDQWSIVQNTSTDSLATMQRTSPPTWPAGLVAMPRNVAYDSVLANAGARPADRDSVDQRAVNGVVNNSGQVINCVSPDGSSRCNRNAGGWPQVAQNQRTLILPNSPNGDDDGDGYTNLEEWLHGMAADLEANGSPPISINDPRPASPTNLQIASL